MGRRAQVGEGKTRELESCHVSVTAAITELLLSRSASHAHVGGTPDGASLEPYCSCVKACVLFCCPMHVCLNALIVLRCMPSFSRCLFRRHLAAQTPTPSS